MKLFKYSLFFIFLFLMFSCATTQNIKSEKQKNRIPQIAKKTEQDKSSISKNSEKIVLSLETADGEKFTTESLKGKYVYISFWATWCEPCKEELKQLREMYDTYKDKIAFVGVSIDTEDTLDKVNEFVTDNAIPFPILVDPEGNTVSKIIPGGDTVPFAILLDKNGFVLKKHEGFAPGDEEKLKKEFDALTK